MSDCITALIVVLLIAFFLGDSRDGSRCGRNRGLFSGNCDSSCN